MSSAQGLKLIGHAPTITLVCALITLLKQTHRPLGKGGRVSTCSGLGVLLQCFHLPDPGIEPSALLADDRQADLNRGERTMQWLVIASVELLKPFAWRSHWTVVDGFRAFKFISYVHKPFFKNWLVDPDS